MPRKKQERKKEDTKHVFVDVIDYHNSDIIPFIKSMGGGVSIHNRKCITKKGYLEEGEGNMIERHRPGYGKIYYNDAFLTGKDYFKEYLILNKFILNYLDKDEYNSCMTLFKSNDQSNIIIGANLLYKMIEDKKQEIIDKLK